MEEEMAESITKEQVLDWVRSATMVDIAGLVKDIETEFGVTAAAPMMMAAGGAGAAAPAVEEQVEFDVILKEVGAQKHAADEDCRDKDCPCLIDPQDDN